MMKPEMKILSVSMNENIASSGNNEDMVIKEIVHQKSGTLSSKWEKYNYLVNPESRTIFDTEIVYISSGSQYNDNLFTLSSPQDVNSCLA